MTRLAVPPGVPLVSAQRRLTLPSFGLSRVDTNGVASATSVRAGATATASASTNTKGSYTEAITATATDADFIDVYLLAATGVNAVDTSLLLDIALGAAGSEIVKVPNLAMGYKAGPSNIIANPYLYRIPVHIPGGSRVAIACQSAVSAATCSAGLVLGALPHARQAPATVVDIGTNLATSRGVAITTPGADNTKGAWVDITTSTTRPFSALGVGLQGNGDTVLAIANCLLDIGISTDGGSTYSVIPGGGDLPFKIGAATEIVFWSAPMLIPTTIPAGARVAARWAASTATGNSLDCILYGVPA